MKIFIKRFFTFCAILLAGWVVGICLVGKIVPNKMLRNLKYTPGNGFTKARLDQADTIKNVDILAIGSSHSYRGFDPRIFEKYGFKLFNLGTSSQTPIQSRYLLAEYLDKIKPRYVIYEAYFNTFQNDGIEASLNLSYSVKKIDGNFCAMIFNINKLKPYNTLLFAAFNKNILGEGVKKGRENIHDKYISGGYVETDYTTLNAEDARKVYSKFKVDFFERQKDAFQAIVDETKKRNIPLIIVQMPILPKRYAAVSNKEEINKYFLAFGLPYYNYNDVLQLDNSSFFDDHHMTQTGVNMVDPILINNLMRHGVLKTGKVSSLDKGDIQ